MARTSALLQSWRIWGSKFCEAKFCDCKLRRPDFCSASTAFDSLFIGPGRLGIWLAPCLAFHTIIATARNPFRGEIVKGFHRQILTFLRFGPANQPFCERTGMALVGHQFLRSR